MREIYETMWKLRTENDKLKAEVERLKTEIDRLTSNYSPDITKSPSQYWASEATKAQAENAKLRKVADAAKEVYCEFGYGWEDMAKCKSCECECIDMPDLFQALVDLEKEGDGC